MDKITEFYKFLKNWTPLPNGVIPYEMITDLTNLIENENKKSVEWAINEHLKNCSHQ